MTHDPYFSVWSMDDRLTEGFSRHWTGTIQAMWGVARIDGKTFRYLGPQPTDGNSRRQVGFQEVPPPMKQLALNLLPPRTIYVFEAAGVKLSLTFFTPALPDDLDILARPVTYIIWEGQSMDGQPHQVSLYFDCSAQWAVNTPEQQVVASRYKIGDLAVLRTGTKQQAILEQSGNDLRIDWGHLYLAVPPQGAASQVIASNRAARETYAQTGKLPDADDLQTPRGANDNPPVLATTFELGEVGPSPVSRMLLLAYDDVFSVEYFHRRLRPYWRRKGMETGELLKAAVRDYASLLKTSQKFDEELVMDLKRIGGEAYAHLAVLAYRQTLAAHKLVADFDGTPLYFSKENFSNGCMGTVDVTYPSSPFFLLFNPTLLKAQLVPVLDYARSHRWPWPYAPHDLGRYPLANGQVYGGGEKTEERQMPVEESGNMLIMIAALAKTEGSAQFASKYWPLLTKWAEYLREKGMDPENQLSTDDFAGHLAHNTNLSIKAILALGGYSLLCDMTGRKDEASTYRRLATEMAVKWKTMADDGGHYRLTFDKPGTWSQKYNLVWDRILGLNLFSPEVARQEISFYKTKQNAYGLPLDSRETYTKLDWIVWTATLAESQQDFEAFISPVQKFLQETPDRVPMTDWYWTLDGKKRGFQARSVVGGVYIKMLA
ncbi:MAG TPA: DUF4965 domain-containing protein, partial [Terriglobia bacterium]|nr:DUF4965 domain-containing protein [Terriglobia bacterium]